MDGLGYQKDLESYPILASNITTYLIVILGLISIKTLLQIIFITRLSFFSSVTDWVEIFTYVMTLITILTDDPNTKFSFASICVLAAFLVFAFMIEKLKVFGLFVLAFKKTLIKSATFLPVFLVIYAGFNMSFRLRSQFGVSYYNTTDQSLSISKTFSMVMGDFSSSDMGLENGSIVNYMLYILFICVMPIIVLNMLVGIAVGEISTILSEADIQVFFSFIIVDKFLYLIT
jgi:transient receptor potential cation channel subfamily A protein 1